MKKDKFSLDDRFSRLRELPLEVSLDQVQQWVAAAVAQRPSILRPKPWWHFIFPGGEN